MFKTSPTRSTLRTLSALLVLLVLVPAIFYSAYEIGSLTQSENLIERIYRQQLDAVLFSVNQYSWDIANRWASDIDRIFRTELSSTSSPSQHAFEGFLSSNRGIHVLVIADTTATPLVVASPAPRDSTRRRYSKSEIASFVRAQHEIFARLAAAASDGLQKNRGGLH